MCPEEKLQQIEESQGKVVNGHRALLGLIIFLVHMFNR